MRRTVPILLIGAVFSPFVLAGCASNEQLRGFAPTPGSVEKLEVNTQGRDDVVRLIGSPSAVATFNPNIWYYISEKQEGFGPMKPWIADQEVIQLTFNDGGRLQNIKKYDKADGRDITMVSRITPTAGKGLTVLEQIMGNVGRFSTPKQSGSPGAPTGGGI
ncbi:MAG: outer membrane protein assembly factor BamE [Proteobacteria bacterium]|nr:outer membrane protein assembly factor BamE [Pseudomonadota bacterium]